jgi:DNA-binding CsgD family transcriptional regulator
MTPDDDILQRAMRAAYDLHRHRDAATFPAWMVGVLARHFRCDSAILATVDPATGACRMDTWPPSHFERLDREEVVRLHAADHPFVARLRSSRTPHAFRLGDLVSGEAFSATGLYSKLYRFLGIEHQLLMLVASADPMWRVVALNRRDRDFLEEERAALESLWPHITLARRRLRHDARTPRVSALDAPMGDSPGMLVVGSDGSVCLCNEQARIWLAEYFDAVYLARRVTLPTPLMRWALERIGHEAQGRKLRVVRRDPFVAARGDRFLAADIVVDHGKDLHLIRLEEAALNAPASGLEAMGLTAREAQVLSWVAQGKTNREVGMILDCSPRTVQKHLEHVFQKIGTESRTAAVLKAWQAGRQAVLGGAPTRPSSRR